MNAKAIITDRTDGDATPVLDSGTTDMIVAYVGMRLVVAEDQTKGIWRVKVPEALACELDAELDVAIDIRIGDGRYTITIPASA